MTTNGKPGEGYDGPDDDGTEWSFDTRDLPTRESDPMRHRPVGMSEDEVSKAAAICALLLLVLAGTGLILERVYPQDHKPGLSDCALMDNAAKRLTCYDKFAQDSATQPAKGAAPPAGW